MTELPVIHFFSNMSKKQKLEEVSTETSSVHHRVVKSEKIYNEPIKTDEKEVLYKVTYSNDREVVHYLTENFNISGYLVLYDVDHYDDHDAEVKTLTWNIQFRLPVVTWYKEARKKLPEMTSLPLLFEHWLNTLFKKVDIDFNELPENDITHNLLCGSTNIDDIQWEVLKDVKAGISELAIACENFFETMKLMVSPLQNDSTLFEEEKTRSVMAICHKLLFKSKITPWSCKV